MTHCKLCTRNFFGDAERKADVKGEVCAYCRAEINRLKQTLPNNTSCETIEQMVAQRKRLQLNRLSPTEMRKAIRESEARDKED